MQSIGGLLATELISKLAVHAAKIKGKSRRGGGMRLKIFPWLGQEFVHVSAEGNGEGSVEDETQEVFARFARKLAPLGLTLDHTVRSRMFVRDMDAWTAGVHERVRILKGLARSVSSSHVWPERLIGKARISVDMLAMFPPKNGSSKEFQEYEPSTIVLRRMNWGGLLFLSGVTDMTHTTFDEQFPVIIKRLTDTLANGRGAWEKVQHASFFLHHEEKLGHLKACFREAVPVRIPSTDYTFVGTRQGKRLEVELTAKLD
jgi:enamine deaminase RidA (YjgF/YER057c/UK114 family)